MKNINEFITPVGRLVQGSMELQDKIDPDTNAIVRDDKGNPVKEAYFAVAFSKTDPLFGQFYAQMVNVARQDFPHLFDAAGNCTHPRFSWKLQDGDGRDSNGKSVADKPGFAGHWIVKFGSQYAPRCFRAGAYDASQQLQNPAEVIKRGHYVRVGGIMRGNGVKPNENKVPGLFISGNLVEWVAFGQEIASGPDANKVFGGAPLPSTLPPGASATPVGAPGAATPPAGAPAGLPPLPGVQAAPAPLPGVQAAPAPLPGVQAAPAGLPPLPAAPAPAAPVYEMTEAAGGYTREQYLAGGWTDDALIAQGKMIRKA